MFMLLSSILFILLFSVILILLGSSFFNWSQSRIQLFSISTSLVCFFLSTFLWILFDRSSVQFQFSLFSNCQDLLNSLVLFNENSVLSSGFALSFYLFSFGVDGISLFFILLTTFITPLCLLTAYKKNLIYSNAYCVLFLILEIFLIAAFASTDLFTFFVFFESILLPMFFIIGVWGSRERRLRAAVLFFLYTLFGSIFLLFGLVVIFNEVGTTSFFILNMVNIPMDIQLILWLCFFFSLSIKIPTLPMHIWLPEAHVEAPTAGSVILAGLLLKLGGYGFIRVLLPLFSSATVYYMPLVDTLAIISIIYASLTTIRQVDLKRIIAYSSVAHMNLVVLGVFSGNVHGIGGSIFLMIAHGIVSSALFFLIGVLYDRYSTRLIYYYGGLVKVMPVFSAQLLLFCMANVGLPGTCNFIGELVVFAGLVDKNIFVLLVAATGVVLSVLYTIFFYNRVAFGNLNNKYSEGYKDMSSREWAIIMPLTVLTILLGVFPDLVFDTILCSVSLVVYQCGFF